MAKLEQYVEVANSREHKEFFEDFKDKIFQHTLRWEGGSKLHNVKGDSGGWTIWGIAYNYNKSIFKNLDDFKDTTYDEAAAIAYIKYYKIAYVNLVPKESRLMYFDMAYNMGTSRAIKIMQKCIGVKSDGIIGPMTKSKMNTVCEGCLYNERNTFYNNLVRQNYKFKKFIKGWLNRSKAIFNIN